MIQLLWKSCAACLLSSLLFASCSSKPKPPPVIRVEAKDIVIPDVAPSYDGNKRDSGLLVVDANGALVTEGFLVRYDDLVRTYGADHSLTTPWVVGTGVIPATEQEAALYPDRGKIYRLTKQALVTFIQFNQWRKAGRPHPTPPKDPQ